MKKLAIVTTHPIQYNAPWFRLLTQRNKVALKVFYTWSQIQTEKKFDPDFGEVIEWDLPLLDGYNYEFVDNISAEPGSHHFNGINNPSLNKTIERWEPDAVLVFGWAFKSHLTCLRHFKGKIPVLFRGDSTLLDERPGLKTAARRLFLKWIYRYIDVALYVGTNNKAYFRKHGVPERKLVLARHAIDNDRFTATPQNSVATQVRLKESAGIKESDFVVLFAGKLESKKNPFFVLELAKQIANPDIIFLIVGNGHLQKALQQASVGDKRIRFLNFQNQTAMPALYRLASLYLLPSVGPGETWGLAANEAMACGKPVLLSNKAGGAVDLVKGNGVIFDPGNIGAVATAISNYKNNSALYRKACLASLNHIKNFHFSQIAAAVENSFHR